MRHFSPSSYHVIASVPGGITLHGCKMATSQTLSAEGAVVLLVLVAEA